MEKLSFVKNGVLRLPPGFRFHPTDEELVVQYLRRKVLAWPLPASIIPEVHVCKADPWDLPGDLEQERYFFSTREAKYPNTNRSNRATVSGYWKATGLDKQIVASRGNRVVGMKKTLVFYRGKAPNGCRTDWIMHEYRVVSAETAACNVPPHRKNQTQTNAAAMENWVLCRIFLKKRSGKNDESCNNQKPVFYDFLTKDRTDMNLVGDSSSSSVSSGITQVSSNDTDDHEESSCCNSFPYFRRKP
ncbi:VND-interacting 2, NAC domain containing protein 83 [Hibiscus trionum]|uniref:VND-interacting 2, NAC domain containing protein 83 n=1 Tax=Hibiscus trionum TaxID=183268 RepID=A0A9W7J0Q8_HIBTR|nr:VND-interacting 2, NAC domain containing protein 83 [Hibiscus trionum]